MKQAIRALGWATNIFWIALLFFTVTIVYSAFQISPEFGEPTPNTIGDALTVSLPFSIDNGGFYDIYNLNLTTLVKDGYGLRISYSSTLVHVIPHGSNISITHNIPINISQITTRNLSYLLFNDSNFDVDMALRVNYANAIPFQISTSFPMPWGAPLNNLTMGQPTATVSGVDVPLSFENHSFFELNGTIRLQIVDKNSQVVGEGTIGITVPPQRSFTNDTNVPISGSPADIREARLFFETSVFDYGPVVVPLV